MKTDFVKLFLVIALSVLVGLLFFMKAPEAGDRNWIAFIIMTLGQFLTLAPALAFSFPEAGNRMMTAKVFAWVAYFIVLLTGFLFCRQYFSPFYFAVTIALEAVIFGLIFYAVIRKRG
jgi:cytochrome b subunit of formate dehydrogenase